MIRTKATNKRLRDEIQYKRKVVIDLFGGKCEVCSFSNKKILEIHHVLPISKGGDNNWENLSILCPNCHRSVHDLLTSNEPVEDLNTYICEFDIYWDNFLSIFKQTLNAVKKQNEIKSMVIEKRMKHFEIEMEKNNHKINMLQQRLDTF